MQYRRLHLALLLMLLGAFSVSGVAQTATYHLHKEASAITAADDKLLTAGPDGTSLAITTALTGKVAGEYLIKEFETQTGVPATAGVVPSGSTLTFNLFMRKTANVGTVFPRAKIRLNNATGTLLCTATGTTALTTTVAKRTISCTTTADIAMTAADRFYLWTGVNLTATSTTTFNGELDVEGTLNGNFDSTIVLPLGTPAPSITSLTPATGAVNTTVVIAGANFRAARGTSTVTFNGVASTPTVWSATSITTPVPAGATTGPVVITVGGQPSNASTFTVTPSPSISSLAPNTGAIGSVVTISGANFGPSQGNGSVKFGTVVATVSSWSPTSIVATVPTGAVTGSVVVTAAGGVASAGVTFTVTAAPAITTVTPAAGGGFGSSFTITGTNFGPSQGNGKVTLNTITATVTSWSSTSIVAEVPNGVTSGNVVVTAAGGISSNGVRFKVLNPGGLAVDQTVFADGTTAGTTRATAAFSTSSANELLLAFVSSGKGTAATTTVTGVAGASLTWALVQRTNTQLGTSEIWRAFATAALTNVTVTATFSQSVLSSMTVVSFTGADTSGTNGSGAVGATVTANAATGAPTATLTTTRANSVVFAVGDDPTAKVARTIGANQSLVHQLLCGPAAQTCTLWVQQIPTLIPASGTAVTINDTAPTADAWNLSLVEIKPAATVVTPSITSLTPASGPIGTSVTIAGSNFGSPQGSSTVTFGGINAAVTSWSTGSIVVTVPAGVPLGAVPVLVTVPGAGTSNSVTFAVVNPLAISAIVSPLPNGNGWNNTNVTVSYVCSGGVAPVVCPGPQTATTEGANKLVAATATDAIGEHATVSVTVSIDKTNPIINASVSPAPVNGVVTAPATVTFTCSDALSGVASCPAPINVNTPGANQTFSGTATDRAGNSATASVTFSLETAVFSLTGTPAPPANVNGWNNTSVTITYTCSGGVAPVQCPAAKTITLEGANQVISATATDGAGQTASTSTTLNIDKTPPTITASVIPAPGTGGVVTAPAVITFVCSDALSGTASCSSPITVTTVGAGQTFNGTATDKAGNSASTSVTLSVQLTPLTISASAAPAANAAGWNNTSVTVSFLCAGGVPPLNCPAGQTLTAEGANQIVNGTVTDGAGQSASTSLTVSIDKTPPVSTATVTPAANGVGVVTAPATITFTCTDALSGIASCPSPISVTTAGAGQVFNGSATDKAGNTASTSVTLTVQLTPLTVTASAAPAANAAGWNNTAVTVSFLCAGGVPPLQCPAAQTVTTEGANQIISGTVTDASAQTASTSITVSIDETAPIVSAAFTPAPNANGVVTAPATITFTCSDALSGIAICPSPITVTTAGASQAFSGTATDKAGNTAGASVNLTVQTAPLTVVAVAAPPANAAGWNNSPVTVSFVCSGGVPPLNCPAPQTASLEGANQIVSGSVIDAAGQSASTSVTLNIDLTPPTISADVSPLQNNSGIIVAPTATITFTCTDTLSGVFNCPSPITVSTSGLQTFNGTATDIAGNTTTTSVQVNLQTNPPLTVKASVSPTPNAAGWINTQATISFQCDGGIPPINCPASIPVSTDGANQVFSGTATDSSGATASDSITINVDQTAPLLAITAPTDGSVSPTVSISVTGLVSDSGSGLASVTCNGVAASFSASDFNCSVQTTNGTLALSVQAVDVAGNTSTSTISATLQGPKLTISDPIPLALFANNSITVTGTVDDPNAVVAVNGISATITNGIFTAPGVILREGSSVVTATGTNTGGAKGTASVNVVLDTTPPIVTIDSPSDGVVVTTPQIYVTGMVNDVVPGSVNSAQVTVTLNGVTADVSNRTFMAEDILLVPGKNVLTAVAKDRAGNVSQSQITVTLLDSATQQRILMVSGNGQTGPLQTVLPQPLVIQAINGLGQAIPNLPVTYTVNKSDGTLSAFPQQGRQITVQTDADGRASVNFQIGTRVGKGNNQVLVTSPGFIGEVMFCSTGTVGSPIQIHDIAGEGQTGVVGQPLAQPMVVVVFDVGGNAVPSVPVVFNVEKGGGTLEGGTTVTKVTDSDGRASATLVLTQEEGVGNNVVSASFDGLTGSRVAFVASGATPKNADNTTVTGIVLDGGNSPVVNATASIQGTNLKALTDTSGRFTITNAPVGSIDLFIDGSTSTAGEPYPFLEFPMVTIAGQDNHLPSPIYLPELDFDNSKVVGGDEDVTLTMKGMPGVQFTVLAHSATFPDGSKVGRMSVSQVHSDKVPMPPPNATAPHLFWTVQPPRVRFDPPMRIQIPNTEGLPAGTVTEIFCYNHDLEEFASGGTARVSEDGSFIVSDKGSGVIVSGWGDAPPPPPPPTCADGCGKCGVCKDGACVIDPPLDPVGVSVARSFGLPSETVDNINTGLAKLSTLGILASVNLLEVEGKVAIKECCDAELGRGFNTKGSVTGNFGGFTVQAKIWPPGPIPTIDVKVAVLGLASLEVKAQFIGGFFLGVAGKVEGEVGFKQNDCKEEDKDGCFFASLKVGVTFTASLQVGASVSVTTDCFFCVKTTTSAEGTLNLGKFSLPLNIAAISYNDESCHSGVKGGTWQFEPGTAEISATFKGKWEPEGGISQGFNVTFNFLKCTISLDTGVDCKSAL